MKTKRDAQMETYDQVNKVMTWHKELGSGEPLLMLHPGGVDSSAFGANIDALASHFRLYLPERRGHVFLSMSVDRHQAMVVGGGRYHELLQIKVIVGVNAATHHVEHGTGKSRASKPPK